ncbi:Mitochondrial zinc maintenance protein 1, mitochondrial [Saxophila tyrrhenica]|uniref:Mitochondrial zinc maintenance protein 1, mitochondrial n=1 Tax=Saxophila tyrrhenica TaxID=1690608 RepID=A0AAV9P9J1_9PEZI|nr:Mitochondrial zinc maintenance protein 1, mitochondrial [Saxophila tyrrhenica]
MTSKYLSPADLATNRLAVLLTYRHLLRATRLAFGDDTPTLLASRAQARASFLSNAALEPGDTEATTAIEHAQGVTKILREHVVQGRNVGGEQYRLRIHEHTQKLNNEQAKLGKGTTKGFKEIKNSQF